ncbi:phage regulatory CII family protein [Brucella pseudogrignonensis]|uniref:phage regulatory CII family protein n=1 Tax=Brucella pseudogrignonensis TaxID=419475 RepID=UPI0038D20F00
MRTISEQEQRSLKSATDGAYALAGGISCILPFTRVSTSTLSKYASFNDEHHDSFVPLDVAIEIDRKAQTPTIVRQAAALLGFDLVAASDLQGDENSSPVTAMDAHRIMSETMDVSQAVLTALEDGRIDAGERKLIAKEVREAMRALQDLLCKVEG